MASYNAAKFVLLYLTTLSLLFASLPQGHAGLLVSQIRIDGFVYCTPTGNRPTTGGDLIGAAGVIVSGSCNGGSGNIGMAVTNTSGFYSVLINAVDGILFDVGVPCFATVKLPVTGTTCQVFLPTGILQAPTSLLSVVTNVVGGLLGICTALPFQYIS